MTTKEENEKPPRTTELLQSAEQSIEKTVGATGQKAKEALYLLWDELPNWRRDNHYIHSGYRPESNSYFLSAISVLSLHNETVNIWTHMVAALAGIPLALFLYGQIRPRYELAQPIDVAVFACFFGGVGCCLGMSATYHAICNHSEEVARVGNRFDYVGIVLCIWGSYIPCLHYGFARDPALARVYWTMITTVGAGTLLVVLVPKFRTPEWRPVRAGTFVAMGLSGIAPIIHGLRLYGLAQLELQMSLSWTVLQGVLYIVGAAIYAARVPERWRPGAFDLLGSSHQIFHVLIVLAATSHLIGLLKAFDYDHSIRIGAI